MQLTSSQRRFLLDLARSALRERLLRDSRGDEPAQSRETEVLPLPRAGLFVTLKECQTDGGLRLRGCVGQMQCDMPLDTAVREVALRAAFEDPRFAPLTLEELTRVRISISVLSPLEPLDDPQALVPGRDGVQLELGRHRAVFLPQVAPDQGWNRQQLLEQLACKAGLPAEGWRDARLSVFRAETFAEAQD